jgi:hypothetical protein
MRTIDRSLPIAFEFLDTTRTQNTKVDGATSMSTHDGINPKQDVYRKVTDSIVNAIE